jgi:hypothetical protein
MKNAFALMALLLAGLASQAAYAGSYLQFLHNNSAESVYITAKVPGGWVDVPHYPVIARPRHSLFDERVFWDAYYKLCRHEIRNVAVPPGGDCGKDTYMEIRVGNIGTYRLYDCDWKIHVQKKEGNAWKKHGDPVPIHAVPVNFWNVVVDPNGNLTVGGERKNLSHGDLIE